MSSTTATSHATTTSSNSNKRSRNSEVTTGANKKVKEDTDSDDAPVSIEDHVWKVHQLAEDYIELASNLVLSPTSELGTYGYNLEENQYPMETFSALGFLTGPLRRPLVIERWAPLEIGLFEAGMAQHGKDFSKIQKIVKTKTTSEIVEFYYIWKKTSHYKRWKDSFADDEEDEDEKAS